MKKLFVLILLVSSLIACAPKPTDEKVLTILTSSGYPPYEMVDVNGNLYGFDIDLGNAIGELLGYTVKWVDMDFDGIIQSLNAARGDMAIAAMSPDPARDVLFSDSYYIGDDESPFFVLTKVDSGIASAADFVNKTAGVQIGTIQEAVLNKMKDELSITLDPRKDVSQMVQEIMVGRIDFILVEALVAGEYVNQFPQLTRFELEHEAAYASSGTAIALPKYSTKLDDVNQALSTLKENGTLDQLIKKWFTE